MPAFAPRSVIRSHAARMQSAHEAHALEVVIIAGVSYPAEVVLQPIEPMTDAATGSVHLVERGSAKIRKHLLPSPPARDSVLRINAIDYLVQFCGASPNAAAWKIQFHRLPPSV